GTQNRRLVAELDVLRGRQKEMENTERGLREELDSARMRFAALESQAAQTNQALTKARNELDRAAKMVQNMRQERDAALKARVELEAELARQKQLLVVALQRIEQLEGQFSTTNQRPMPSDQLPAARALP
ncbi:MAG: hypothetical protein ACUVWX_04300, partial [Kiritimatiellia bacterium]